MSALAVLYRQRSTNAITTAGHSPSDKYLLCDVVVPSDVTAARARAVKMIKKKPSLALYRYVICGWCLVICYRIVVVVVVSIKSVLKY